MKKIAVVTGASSGMGREAAVQLADQFGWLDEIWLIARREERLSRLRKELPCPSRIFELDLTKQTALSALSAALEEEQPESSSWSTRRATAKSAGWERCLCQRKWACLI